MSDTVILKNGAEEVSQGVTAVTFALKDLLAKDPLGFYELVSLARDPQHKVWSAAAVKKLQDRSLLEDDGRMHSTIRNIILSGVEGDMPDMHMTDPIKRG